MPKGAVRLLQFEVDWSKFFQGRLNQIVPLEDASDCGANTLLLLGRINEEFALELSMDQTMCGGHYKRLHYLFPTFLFTEIEKKYEYQKFDTSEELLRYVTDELKEGYGTMLFMGTPDKEGHYVCIQKDLEEAGGGIAIADLQNGHIIRKLDGYFDPYTTFIVPTTNRKHHVKAESPLKKKTFKENRNPNEGGKRRKRRTRRKN
jgi:hypothetical protein